MYSWRNFVDKAKRYFPLESFEKRGLVITILLLSFIFSFRDWGIERFDLSMGMFNFIIIILVVTISFAVRELAHRTISVWVGYRSQYKTWILGLVIGLVVAFVSNGKLMFIAPGSIVITHLAVHRLGHVFHEVNYKHLGWIAMTAPIANIIFAVLLKSLFVATGSPIFFKAMMINIWIALFDMVPVPPFNGSMTFFGSRYVYIFVLGAMIGCSALLAYVSGIIAIIGALILGALMLFVFFVQIDKRW